MVLKNALFLQNRVLKNAPFEFFLQKTIDIHKEIWYIKRS